MTDQATGLQLRSTVRKDGILEVSLTSVPIPEPKPDEVVVRVEASPINPSDLGLMFAGADLTTAQASGTPDNSGRHGEHPARDLSGHRRARGSVVAGRQRRRGRGGARRVLRTSAGADGQDGGDSRRRHVRAVPRRQGGPVPRPPGGHHAGAGRLVLREPAHRTRHGRDDAQRRSLGSRAHGGGLEPGSDAPEDLPQGRHRDW